MTEELTKNEKSPLLEMIYCDFVTLQQQNEKNISMLENHNMEHTILPECHTYENELIQNIIVVLQLVIQANTEKRIAEKILDTHFSVKKA